MKIVKELLDDRSSETSSRPFFYALDAVTEGKFFVLSPSGKLGFTFDWHPVKTYV